MGNIQSSTDKISIENLWLGTPLKIKSINGQLAPKRYLDQTITFETITPKRIIVEDFALMASTTEHCYKNLVTNKLYFDITAFDTDPLGLASISRYTQYRYLTELQNLASYFKNKSNFDNSWSFSRLEIEEFLAEVNLKHATEKPKTFSKHYHYYLD